MSLTKFTGNTNVVSQLADVPVQTGDELKAKFDEAGTSIKNYLNNTLTTEVEQLVATEKTALQNSISSLSTSTTNSINELNTNKNTMISDGYSNTKVYKIGDLCIYNDTLYRCTTAIDEGEAWNSSHWEQTNLGDEVRKSKVHSTEEVDTGEIWIDGKKIYRKTFTNLTFSDHLAEIDISGLNVDTIFFDINKSLLCWHIPTDEIRWAPIIQTSVSRQGSEPEPTCYQSEIYTNNAKTTLTVSTGKYMIVVDCIVTIEYTKTTD